MSWGPGFTRRADGRMQPRPRPAPDPPAPDGLRASAWPATALRRARAGTARTSARAGRPTTGSPTDDGVRRAGSTRTQLRTELEIAVEPIPAVWKGLVLSAPPFASGSPSRAARTTGSTLACPGGDVGAAEHWQRMVMNQVGRRAHPRSTRPERRRGRDQRRRRTPASPGASTRASTTPSSTSARRSRRDGGFDVVICEQVLEHVVDPWRGGGEPARAVQARRPRDRLDAVSDQGPRAPRVRDARLLALYAAGPAHCCSRARGSRSTTSSRGATASACRKPRPLVGAPAPGTRFATSPTSRCRSGRSRTEPAAPIGARAPLSDPAGRRALGTVRGDEHLPIQTAGGRRGGRRGGDDRGAFGAQSRPARSRARAPDPAASPANRVRATDPDAEAPHTSSPTSTPFPPVDGLPVVTPDQLTAGLLRAGDPASRLPARARRRRPGRRGSSRPRSTSVFAARERFLAGDPDSDGYYEEFRAADHPSTSTAERGWVTGGGGIWLADSPRLTFDVLEHSSAPACRA